MIYFTSDLHLCHNKQFLYGARGFETVEQNNQAIINNWNNVVTDNDDVYILGDLMLNNNDIGMEILQQLKGHIHIIIGNHDTDTRVALYKNLPNLVGEVKYADIIKYNGYHFYLSHYPTYTGNFGVDHLKACLINLYGHTHQQTNFFEDNPFMYHVGLDSHSMQLVSVEQIIEDCKIKFAEYLEKNKEQE